ncbi:hypothetical protein ABZS66_28140 [Dactylosporangium sp. NPDC005572]|uniref:hypothetical protein n=1 Tax=Dactylosporangium sp. NPDC005572 TaxID=3156889 RepID=UPI0033ABD4DB
MNAAIDEANTTGRNVEHLYVTEHWVGKLERGKTRWPHEERRTALRRVLDAATDAELGLYSTRVTDAGYAPERGHSDLHQTGAGASISTRGLSDLELSEDESLQADGHIVSVADRPSPDRDPRLFANGLDRPAAWIIEADDQWQLPATSLEPVESGVVVPLDLDGGDDVDLATAHVRRRSLLVGLAAVTAATGVFGAGRGPRRRIGPADVSRLNALTSLYRLADQEFGGGDLASDVGRFAQSASALLDHVVSDAVRPKLLVAIATARHLAGWTAFDATRHSDAQRHFAAAERFAIEAGDRQLVAHVRYGQAKQMQHLRHNRDALDILRLAHHQLDATPALTTILRGAEAASRGAIGDWEGAKQALDCSSDAFTDVDPSNEPEWLGFLDKGELLAQYGRVYRDWARADPRKGGDAVLWVTDAINAFGPQNTRSTVLNQVGLASAYFLADAPDLALQAGTTAQRQAATLTSPRVKERIANLRRDAVRHMHLPEVAAFVRALPQPVPAA